MKRHYSHKVSFLFYISQCIWSSIEGNETSTAPLSEAPFITNDNFLKFVFAKIRLYSNTIITLLISINGLFQKTMKSEQHEFMKS